MAIEGLYPKAASKSSRLASMPPKPSHLKPACTLLQQLILPFEASTLESAE